MLATISATGVSAKASIVSGPPISRSTASISASTSNLSPRSRASALIASATWSRTSSLLSLPPTLVRAARTVSASITFAPSGRR